MTGDRQCDTCRYCLMTVTRTNVVNFECRRLPPSIAIIHDRPTVGFPQVNSHDWCGEWEHTK